MFNGIINTIGKIEKVIKKGNNSYLKVISKMTFKKDEIGSSISCSGACLTVEKFKKNMVSFYLSNETLKKTIFSKSKKGDIINLEKSLKYGDRISGHFVQGHVDTTTYIKKITILGKSWLINFHLAKKYERFVVSKGSIAINGVSLTIAKIFKDSFQIAIIPHTLKLTNLINLKEKDLVNIEFDIIGKYARGKNK
tara:strand:+ start:538 stop:1122 length:585 start_codon:yes stop_codon:yes gene_type:complete